MSLRSDAQSAFDALPEVVRADLARFRLDNGRTWKDKLCTLWMMGRDERYCGVHGYHYCGSSLRLIRNTVGPSRLLLIRF